MAFIRLIKFPFIPSLSVFIFKKYLLSTYCVPGTVLSAGDITADKIEAGMIVTEKDHKQININYVRW